VLPKAQGHEVRVDELDGAACALLDREALFPEGLERGPPEHVVPDVGSEHHAVKLVRWDLGLLGVGFLDRAVEGGSDEQQAAGVPVPDLGQQLVRRGM
jgi:hypothetical protein